MRVISKARLRQFWELPDHEDSEGPLKAWYKHVGNRTVSWHSPADVKADIASASIVGNCVVFNIAGNKYRLITRILYGVQKVFVLKVMTHEEYDEDKWKKECGCFDPPPARTKKPDRPNVKNPHKRKRS
jgi:mRNA interferase HigB